MPKKLESRSGLKKTVAMSVFLDFYVNEIDLPQSWSFHSLAPPLDTP